MNDLITRIRAIAVVLSSRGTRPGHVGASTKCEAGKLRQELITRFNAEGDRHTTAEFFKTEVFEDNGKRKERLIPDQDREPVTRFIPNAKGEILNVIVQHLVSAAFGHPSLSKDEHEQRILAAAKALPELCDKLEWFKQMDLQSGSSVPSPIESKNEGTTERRMSINVANENLKQLLETDPEKYMAMGQVELASEVGCSRGTLGKTSAYRIEIPKLRRNRR